MYQLLMQNDKDHMHAYAWPLGLPQNGHVVVASTPPGSPPARVRNNISARSLGRTRSGKQLLVNTAAAAASAGGSLVSSSSSQPVGPGWAPRTTTNFLHKLTIHMLFTLFLRRSSRILLLAPFIYITAMVLYIGGSAMELPARFQTCVHIPGSYYRSDEVFNNLWPAMQQTNASISYGAGSRVLKEDYWTGHGRQVLQAWEYPKEGAGFRPCVHHLHHDSTEGCTP